MKTTKELLRGRKLRRLREWMAGRLDRSSGQGMTRNNGDYLDGYHSAEFDTPDFLTISEYVQLKNEINNKS